MYVGSGETPLMYTVCDHQVMIIHPIGKSVSPQNSWLKSSDYNSLSLILDH